MLIAAVADGAGSAAMGGRGAELSCAAWCGAANMLLEELGSLEGTARRLSRLWNSLFSWSVDKEAAASGTGARAFSCTTLGAVVGPDYAAFMQLGDGPSY